MEIKLKSEDTKEIETQVKLHINERLFEQGLITEEMYNKAKSFILTL